MTGAGGGFGTFGELNTHMKLAFGFELLPELVEKEANHIASPGLHPDFTTCLRGVGTLLGEATV
jgi:hypothetical protein